MIFRNGGENLEKGDVQYVVPVREIKKVNRILGGEDCGKG
jgi:hypothetical protein